MFSAFAKRVGSRLMVAGAAIALTAGSALAQAPTPVELEEIIFPVDLGSAATVIFVAFGAVLVAILPVVFGKRFVMWGLKKLTRG